MLSDNIYSTLSTKPHNEHYLKRYYKLIRWFSKINSAKTKEELGYTENHHICPKADDMFPEYINFKQNPWNSIRLTSHQHVLAHVLLWKAYPETISQLVALFMMIDRQNDLKDKSSKRKIPPSISIRYAAKLREEYYNSRLGFSTYKDINDTKYFIHRDDPKIQELNLVGNNTGYTHTNESKESMSRARDYLKSITLYKLDKSITIKLSNTSKIESLLCDNWNIERTEVDWKYIKDNQYSKVSDKMAGRARYCYPDGSLYGMITKEDPAIKEFDLVWMDTDNAKAQRKRRQELAAEVLTGSEIYNNGSIEIRFKSGDDTTGWNKGRLERTESHKTNFANAIQLSNANKTYWNNGITCKKLPNGENPGEGWVAGMLPRNKK